MGWQTAVVGAIGAATVSQQGKIGKINQAVANRNAEILDQEAEQIAKQTDFDIAQLQKQYVKLVGETKVSLAQAGVVSGQDTAYRIEAANARERYLQENIMMYNSKIAQSQKTQQANFARIQGEVAREQARAAQFQTIGSYGTSLLSMGNFGGGKSFSKTYTGFGQSGYGRDPGDIM